ncbi:MAG: 23S rRNA (guanosine(2251)-2'-O)-methyltransferase RlmB [Halofilum sp. (in: g-proteobacteria)]|nr:23S rRNA (guanosine(2251)-2'-O)-methyltransferase RlmB [Halofilum sp. (in: g-proteobacteria)]
MHWTAGIHAVETALSGGAGHVARVLVERRRRDGRLRRLIERATRAGIPVERVDTARLDACVPGVRHQGVCAQVEGAAVLDERALGAHLAGLRRPPFVLVLDRVQDPHNLGACLRSAEAAGVDAVVVPRDRAARVSATVERVAAGAAGRVALAAVTNLARALETLKECGCWVVGTAGDADTTLFEADLAGGLALVLGGEEKGLRARTRAACDRLVAIPMAGRAESLNVSVAAGVCLFEAVRQRRAMDEGQKANRE